MTTRLVPGARSWSMVRAEDGNREYRVKYLVQGAITDGPANALSTPGLPLPGSQWIIENDIDIWAWCKWNASVTPVLEKEPNSYFEIELTFSTKQENKNCHTEQITDPLLDPQKISGSFVKYTEEATKDRFGRPITNSAHEQIYGPQVEFDANRSQVKIEQNVAILGLEIFAPMINTVNQFPLWGLPPRTIKLSDVSWDRKFHDQCNVYYTRNFTFDIRSDTFDRRIIDEAHKVLFGHWDLSQTDPGAGNWILDTINGLRPDPTNPTHFIRSQDRVGNYIKVVLNGHGVPAGKIVGGGGQYIAIKDNPADSDLSDGTSWIPLPGDTAEVSVWTPEAHYVVGELVSINTEGPGTFPSVYICLIDFTEDVPGTSDDWLFLGVTGLGLGGGPGTVVPNDQGDYDSSLTYNIGDIVKDTTNTSAGSIFVQAYRESDFLSLMIPTSF